MPITTRDERERFVHMYETDPSFHDQVDLLMFDEVVRLRDEVSGLRAALGRIAGLRRDGFGTGFQYEMAVRQTADLALGRLSE